MKHARCTAWLSSVFAILLAVTAGAQESAFSTGERVVAVADIHGAYSAFVDVLRDSNVVDADLRWSANASHLVIVGDVLDRGPNSRRALELIRRLESEAAAAGGQVHMLLGNHEVMNLTGDLRYVSDAEYQAFADAESPAMREEAFTRYHLRHGSNLDETATRKEFDDRFPHGFFAHRASFSPDGELGRWLLGHPFIAVINGTAFVHGGLSQAVAGMDAARINDELGSELREYVEAVAALTDAGVLDPTDDFYDHTAVLDAFGQKVDGGEAEWPSGAKEAADRLRQLFDELIFMADSPIWYRGTVGCSPLIERGRVSSMLEGIGATSLVVGHTPTLGATVQERFDRRVVRIDTGMLAEYYGGRASALVLQGDQATVVYAGDGMSTPVPQPRMLGSRPGAMSDDELESFLREAEVSSRAERDGLTILRLRRGNIEVGTVFRPLPERGFAPEVAAYQLDRMLELGMVPVTVERLIDGIDGSVQFVPDRTFTEAQRRENRLGGGAWCPLVDQYEAMYIFDSLIFNTYRTADRILLNENDLRVLLIGHERAFTTDRGRPAYLAPVQLHITASWREKLEALDAAMLEERFGNLLDRRRIRALLARRDALLEGN